MKSVRDILKVKGSDVWCVEPDATVFDALRRMAEKEVGALVVTEGAQVVGLISEREYARKVVLQGRTSPTTLVKEIMITPVMYIHLDQAIEECMSLMTEKRTRHLPVIEDGKLVGLISIGDIVKSIIADQQFLIEQLVRYVSG
ncbi:MAG: CBS domain-containing protein [Candidatus Binatia bacterium]